MTALFLDTSYVIALENLDDQNHRIASAHWKKLLKKLTPLVTTSYVFNETITFFNCKGLHNKAVEIGSNLLSSRFIDLIQVDAALFNAGWEYLKPLVLRFFCPRNTRNDTKRSNTSFTLKFIPEFLSQLVHT